MKDKIRPCLSFIIALVFLINSIPSFVLESRAYERNMEYLVSGNVVSGEEEPVLPTLAPETVSENISVEDVPTVSANIIVNCNDSDMGTIQVFSDGKELESIDSKYSFKIGETIEIWATPNKYYEVAADSRKDMELMDKETGTYRMVLENFDTECEKEFTINFDEIKSVTIFYDGTIMDIGRNMRGGTVSSVNLDGKAGYIRITPENDNKYYTQLDSNILEKCQEDIYKVKEDKIPIMTYIVFRKDEIPPLITISANLIDDTWYINGDKQLFIKIADEESGVKSADTLKDFPRELEELEKGLYSTDIKTTDFDENQLKRHLTIVAEDMCGNVSKNSIDIVYDDQAPTANIVSVNSTGVSFKQNRKSYFKPEKTMKVSLNIEENTRLSYLDYAVYDSKGSERFKASKEETSSKGFVFEEVEIPIESFETGTYSIRCTATDMAGNTSEPVEREFYVDGTSPKIKMGNQDSGKKWYKDLKDVVIEAAISDEFTSDGLSYSYKIVPLNNKISPDQVDSFIDAEEIKPDEWIPLGVSGNGLELYAVSVSADEIIKENVSNGDGSYALLIWAKDGCQNESKPESYVFHCDQDQPNISDFVFKIDGKEINNNAITPFGNFLNKQNVEINIQANDINNAPENYCKGVNPEVEEVFFYYFPAKEENNKSILGVHKELLGNKDKLEQAFVINKVDKNGTIFSTMIENMEEGVPYEIFLAAKDKAGNIRTCELKDIEKYKSSLVMIDQKGPEIDFTIDNEFKKPDYKETIGGEVREWYRGDRPVTFTLTLKDLSSGLFDWKVSVNDEEKWNENFRTFESDKDEKKICSSIKIDLSRGTIGADGHYTFKAEAHDNAGNSSDPQLTNKTIYVDEHVPIVTSIAFSSDKKEDINDIGTSSLQYSFFFKQPINIEATATDFIGGSNNPGSGVKDVTYYLQNIKGKKVTEGNLKAKKKKGQVSTYVANGSVEDVTDFKGQVFISAMDNTGQESDPIGSKGIVIESAKKHKKCSYANIKMSGTALKDANGNPLYNKMPVIRFETSDSLSGIAKNTWKIKTLTSHTSEDGGRLEVNLADGGKTGDTGWTFSKKDKNLVTEASKSYKVKSEKNSLEVSLNLTDNAGHGKKAEKRVFSVDMTEPQVFVEYDNNEAYNEKFYDKERYATIHVIDANFSAEACEIKTTGPEVTKSEWEHIAGNDCNGKIHSKDCEYICRVGFVADGDYTFGFECTDLAGWSGSYGQVDEFTIDLTEPVIQVSYDNQNSQNGNYYKAARTATVQIEEHNFSPEDVSITMTAMDGGNAIAVPAVVGWTQNEDIHTATIAYDYDGEFTFDIEYTDLANNQAEEYEQDRFIIDITEPEIEIAGIVNQSANKGKVQPVITCRDTNLEDVAISLKGANRGAVKADYDTSRTGGSIVYKLKDLEHLEKNDDIYTLHVTAKDMAGNELEEEIYYSVNRFGSVYEYDKQTEALIKDYYSSKCDDLIIKEVNVNTLKVNRITYSKDGEIVTLKEGKDYKLSQSGDEFTWKEYIYTIYKENFEEEGKYILTLYSEDLADNQSDNKIKGKDIEFVIDKTAPSLVLSGVKDGGQYNEDSMELVINAEDNVGLAGLKVYNDGIVIADFDGETMAEAEGTLRIPLQSKNDWQELVVVTRDMAGNESRSETINYLMTTNLLVQWYKNTWLFYGSMVMVLLLAGVVEYFIRLRKGQKKKRMVG